MAAIDVRRDDRSLYVGAPPVTLCVTVDAERPWMHSHAERGNDQSTKAGDFGPF